MKLLRSWPLEIPAGRSYVVDDIEHLVMSDYDYTVLGEVADDVLLLEWDIAVGSEQLAAFAERAATEPGRVLSAPYRLFPGHHPWNHPKGTVWSTWNYRRTQQEGGMVEVGPPGPTAHLSGFGMVYLPAELIRKYLADRKPDWRFSDMSFFAWMHRVIQRPIELDWSARPVHLHQPIPPIGGGPA